LGAVAAGENFIIEKHSLGELANKPEIAEVGLLVAITLGRLRHVSK
jgi:hypothetical protein